MVRNDDCYVFYFYKASPVLSFLHFPENNKLCVVNNKLCVVKAMKTYQNPVRKFAKLPFTEPIRRKTQSPAKFSLSGLNMTREKIKKVLIKYLLRAQ